METYTRYRNLTDSELERTCYGDPSNTDATEELRRRALDVGFLPDDDTNDALEKAESYDGEVTDHEDDVKRLEGEIETKDEEIEEAHTYIEKLEQQIHDAALDLV